MKRVQQGFTLIELMIVVAIIGILAAVALPAYQDYAIKSKWAANLAELEGVKTALKVCLNEEGGTPGQCDTVGELANYGFAGSVLPTPKYGTGAVAASVSGSAVRLTFTGTADVKSLVYMADCQINTGGNITCLSAGTDNLGNYVKGNGR